MRSLHCFYVLINLNSSFLNEYLWRKLFSFPVEQKGIYSQTFETISRIKWLEVGAFYAVHQGNLQIANIYQYMRQSTF